MCSARGPPLVLCYWVTVGRKEARAGPLERSQAVHTSQAKAGSCSCGETPLVSLPPSPKIPLPWASCPLSPGLDPRLEA